MAADTECEDPVTSVDVNQLIDCAVNRHGMAGVVVLLDTCNAGAGIPAATSLIGGYLQGRTRISVLAASQSQQEAYNLDFSREITQWISDGFEDAGEFVPLRRYRSALMETLDQQEAAALDYNGSLIAAEEGLWLAVNARHRAPQGRGQLSEVGAADLRSALLTWPDGAAIGASDGQADLAELHEAAAERGDSIGACRVAEVTHALIQAFAAETFVTDWTKNALSTFTVTRAMKELNKRRRAGTDPLRPPADLRGTDLLRYFLQHEALRGMSMDGRMNCDLALARCIVALAQACARDLDDVSLDAWAAQGDTHVALNDAREEVRVMQDKQRAGAVVSLHAARLDWPESISVWVRHGTDFSAPEHFPCPPTQSGVEQVLPDVVDWAEEQLPAGVRLGHIDVVVPAALFPSWRPEELRAGLYVLGAAERSVTLRWSERLVEPRHLRGLNDLARQQLQVCSTEAFNGMAPIDWLSVKQVENIEQLTDALSMGRYPRAIGIARRDQSFSLLLQTLLPYTPVLLWPADEETALREPLAELVRNWERLPTEFTRAYRWRRLKEHGADGPVDQDGDAASWAELALMRTAWHDEPWLDFCRRFQTSGHRP
ncbi:hypothetical protein [Streptomyces sp. NPDC020298]|uniref:vWA-MoxR associated conflict system protein n=1 Tax=unclassified Streptomyces TaxID=2593676 RepID=UPI0033F6EC4E